MEEISHLYDLKCPKFRVSLENHGDIEKDFLMKFHVGGWKVIKFREVLDDEG
jgi:hypothetical protein